MTISRIERSALILSGICVSFAILGVAYRLRLADAETSPPDRPVPHAAELAGSGYSRGNPGAQHVIVVFSDFECPFCRRFSVGLDTFQAQHPDVRIVERHYPLTTIHPGAFAAALAYECGRAQNRPLEARRLLYASQDSLQLLDWKRFAEVSAMPNSKDFAACVQSERYRDVVLRDAAVASSIGLNRTPSIIVDGIILGTTPSWAMLADRVRDIK